MAAPVDGMTAEARAAVTELLTARGRTITLTPAVGVVTDKPGGGKDYAPAAPRPPQTFALFQVSSAHTGRVGKGFAAESRTAEGGTVRTFGYDMVGAYDAVVGIGDTWEDDVAKYTVESVDHSAAYQTGAYVVGFLKVTGHGFG